MYLRDRVIILKKEPFREQDRRYVMYGREHGLLVAVARGASVPRSKQAGHSEPLCEVEVMIAKGAAFDKLAVSRMLWAPDFFSSKGGLAGVAICGAFADLVIRLTRPGIADDRIFDLLREAIVLFSSLPEAPTPDRARLLHASLMLRLLDLVGFSPDVEEGERGHIVSLLKFMRFAPLADLLRVTTTRDILNEASAFVEESLKSAPLHEEPHGIRTIQAFLR